jgi:tetratricopeptide (TPR) repeat protein
MGFVFAQYQRALEISPDNPEAHYNLGKAFVQKGQLDSAVTQFQEVLRLRPDFSAAQDGLDKVEALLQQQGKLKVAPPHSK